jgi:hypothetical protein
MQSAGAPAVVPIQITAPEVLGATALEALDGEVEVRPARVWGGACPGAPTDSRRRRALIGSSLAWENGVVAAPRGVMGAVPPVHLPSICRLTAAGRAPSIPLTAGRARSARPEANVRCACGSSGATGLGA